MHQPGPKNVSRLHLGFSAVALFLLAAAAGFSMSRTSVAEASVAPVPLADVAAAGPALETVPAAFAVPGAPAPWPPAPEFELPAPAEPELERFLGELRAGQTLSAALRKHGIPARTVHLIATEMRPVFDFRKARPGDGWQLERELDGTLWRFRYTRSALERYTLQRVGDGYVAARKEPELRRERGRIAGVVSSSLYEAIEQLGERPELAHDFAGIFAWDLDFSNATQPGDSFSILYERLFLVDPDTGEEQYLRPGRILAARYANAENEFRAVHFQLEESRGGYYRPDGSAVERQFLRAPLQFRRISSRFSLSRLHPILKVRRPHPGIDYAAPSGTPVWAIGGGKVVYRGRMGGFGKLVKIRHPNGFVSYYGHLSRYADGIKVGDRIGQKQIIGYVGATGLATGPHLDFRLKKHGRWVDPQKVSTPAGPPIPDSSRPAFAVIRDQLLAELEPQPLVAVSEAL